MLSAFSVQTSGHRQGCAVWVKGEQILVAIPQDRPKASPLAQGNSAGPRQMQSPSPCCHWCENAVLIALHRQSSMRSARVLLNWRPHALQLGITVNPIGPLSSSGVPCDSLWLPEASSLPRMGLQSPANAYGLSRSISDGSKLACRVAEMSSTQALGEVPDGLRIAGLSMELLAFNIALRLPAEQANNAPGICGHSL